MLFFFVHKIYFYLVFCKFAAKLQLIFELTKYFLNKMHIFVGFLQNSTKKYVILIFYGYFL